jgi:hypothetical protein
MPCGQNMCCHVALSMDAMCHNGTLLLLTKKTIISLRYDYNLIITFYLNKYNNAMWTNNKVTHGQFTLWTHVNYKLMILVIL